MRSPEIMLVDLDAFYASVERLRRPELRDLPLVVGGAGARGVVLSCSYEARAYGVRNGMPAMRAKRLCPHAVFVPPDFGAYREASERFRAVLESFTPVVEPVSLDEAFCDVSGAHRVFGDTPSIVRLVRYKVSSELGLSCSVGAGPSKFVAKMASRACKPHGLLVVDDPVAFLHPLPVSDMWGVGAATASALSRLGVRTIGELAAFPPGVLRRELGDAAAELLPRLAMGEDGGRVETELEARSVGAEETFERDISSNDRIEAEILRLSDRVASRLVAAGLSGRTVTVKIRLADFETHTRSKTLPRPTNDVFTISSAAREAFGRFKRGRRGVRGGSRRSTEGDASVTTAADPPSRLALRLVGVTVSGLQKGARPEQLSFDRGPDYAGAEEALERVRGRFGSEALRLARLVE